VPQLSHGAEKADHIGQFKPCPHFQMNRVSFFSGSCKVCPEDCEALAAGIEPHAGKALSWLCRHDQWPYFRQEERFGLSCICSDGYGLLHAENLY